MGLNILFTVIAMQIVFAIIIFFFVFGKVQRMCDDILDILEDDSEKQMQIFKELNKKILKAIE